MGGQLNVEVVYAAPDRVLSVRLAVPPGTSILQTVELSGLVALEPGALSPERIGVFGRLQAPDTPVQDGDRVEIYRLLLVDPKTRRRQRARNPSLKGAGYRD